MDSHELKKCLVCGDKASACNFNGAPSCVCCKMFFRRNAFKLEKMECHRDGNCYIDIFTRKCCPSCRLRKCLAIGMKKELISSRKNIPKRDDNQINCKVPIEEQIFYQQSALNAHEMELINEVHQAGTHFCNERNLKIVGQVTNYVDAFNLQANYIRKVIKFCKHIPAFRDRTEVDQLAMLKLFYTDVMAIRMAFLYDPHEDAFLTILNEQEDQVAIVPMKCWSRVKLFDLETYCRKFLHSLQALMQNDIVIRDLIIASLLFNTRNHDMCCSESLRYNHLVYTRLLKRYLEYKFSNDVPNQIFTSLMRLFNEMTFIRQMCDQIHRHETERSQLASVLIEIYNLQ